jgi:catechol 2,3-dioxygenase-like lactoylglutathione lyase family enzyme
VAFDHVTLRVSDPEASKAFYADALAWDPGHEAERFAEWGDFSLILLSDGTPATKRAHLTLSGPGDGTDPDGNLVEGTARGNEVVVAVRFQVADVDASVQFWDTVARVLDARVAVRCVGGEPTQNLHVAFTVSDNTRVDEFHRVLTAAGYRDNGAAGERPQYHDGYYGAFVLDPDGNNIEAVCHNR